MLTNLSPALRRHVLQAQQAPRRSADELERAVNRYLRTVRDMATRDPFVDAPLAERIGAALVFLLHRAHRFDDDQRTLLQAAVLYFIEADDEAPDSDGLGGFHDDAEVVDYVLEHLGFAQHQLGT